MNQPNRRPTLSAQIGWAEGQAAQHARLAARNPADSPARRMALARKALAEAAARTLRTLKTGSEA